MRADPQMETICRNLAIEVHAKELALLVTVALSIVLIEGSGALLADVDTQG